MEKRWKETAIGYCLAFLLFTLAPSLAIVDVQSRVADLAGNHSTGSFLPTAWHQCRWRAECCRAWYSIDLNFLPQLFVVIIVVMVKINITNAITIIVIMIIITIITTHHKHPASRPSLSSRPLPPPSTAAAASAVTPITITVIRASIIVGC